MMLMCCIEKLASNVCFALFVDPRLVTSCSQQKGGCDHVCVPTPTGPRCACPDGFNHVSDRKCSFATCKCSAVQWRNVCPCVAFVTHNQLLFSYMYVVNVTCARRIEFETNTLVF